MAEIKFLDLRGEVIAFSDPDVYALARYAVTFTDNVYKRVGGGFTIFNHRTAKITDVVKTGVREYRISFYPSLDAASLYKVCKIITGG